MPLSEPTMTYTVLRDARYEARGIVRLESTPEQLQVFLRAEADTSELPLRLLLVSTGDEGAALDLGQPSASADGGVRLECARPPEELRLWDAVVLTEDWPAPRLIAAGWLRDASAPLWRIKETIEQFLRFPLP